METSNGVEVYPSLPGGIIRQILKELPAKTLLRLRCVSKAWCSIIDDPYLAELHHARAHTRPEALNILFLSSKKDWRRRNGHESDDEELEGEDYYGEHGSSRLYSVNPEEGEGGAATHVLTLPYTMSLSTVLPIINGINGLIYIDGVIWNPSTREKTVLPPVSLSRQIPEGFDSHSFETSSKGCLGYDPCTKKYKVLKIISISFETRKFKTEEEEEEEEEAQEEEEEGCWGHVEWGYETEYRIMTLGSDSSWRAINSDSVPPQLRTFYMDPRSNQFCCPDRHVIYFWGRADHPPPPPPPPPPNPWTEPPYRAASKRPLLLAFEVGSERFRIISLPADLQRPKFIPMGHHLGAVDQNDDRLYLLESYETQTWTMYTLNFPHLRGSQQGRLSPVGTIHSGELLLLSPSHPSTLYYYNLQTRRIRRCKVSDLPQYRLLFNPLLQPCMLLPNHVETIFRLKSLFYN